MSLLPPVRKAVPYLQGQTTRMNEACLKAAPMGAFLKGEPTGLEVLPRWHHCMTCDAENLRRWGIQQLDVPFPDGFLAQSFCRLVVRFVGG